MARWRREIRIKQFFYDGRPFEDLRRDIVAVLRWQREHRNGPQRDLEFQEIVAELAAAADREEFDEWLDALYDWADANLVWIGGTPQMVRAEHHRWCEVA